MRLLHAERLDFEEFYDDKIPRYAILSHRWSTVDQEVSYVDFKARSKESTTGFAKILNCCTLARRNGLEYCWIDTCCIDKTSSAELSEAINGMYEYYQQAVVCYAYLYDVSIASAITDSDWFSRGWTLQELLAPTAVEFYNQNWLCIGTRVNLRLEISTTTGIDRHLLRGITDLDDYSVAQKMCWAARRKTSRLEDQAYCLLGLFGVHMPLLYGEGAKAFRRLQEEILARGGDNSIFAWGDEAGDDQIIGQPSILAPSPADFLPCGNIQKGFATQRILFEVTSRGMLVLIHRSYNRETLNELLEGAKEAAFYGHHRIQGLTIPLGCYQRSNQPGRADSERTESYFLQLILDRGKWRRIGVTSHFDARSMAKYKGSHFSAYTNDCVRIFIHHDWPPSPLYIPSQQSTPTSIDQDIVYLHLRDALDLSIDGPSLRNEGFVGTSF